MKGRAAPTLQRATIRFRVFGTPYVQSLSLFVHNNRGASSKVCRTIGSPAISDVGRHIRRFALTIGYWVMAYLSVSLAVTSCSATSRSLTASKLNQIGH